MRVAPRRGAQDLGRVAGGAVPVGVEGLRSRVEEHEAGEVRRPGRCGIQLGEQGASEGVGGEDVQAIVAHIGGGAGDRVERPLDLRPDPRLRRAPTRGRPGGMGGASKVEEVSALGVVELERSRQRLKHAFGDAAQVSAFQAGVVRNADAGQDSDLFAAQARDASRTVGRHACLLGGNRGAAGGQELLDLLPGLHDDEPRPGHQRVGDPASTSLNRDSHLHQIRALVRAMSSPLATSTAKDGTVKTAHLGTLEVSRIGLGAMTMAGTYTSEGALDNAESIRTIHRALDLGVTHIDTAEIYGPFLSEDIVGEAVRGRRDQVVIGTKFGLVHHGEDDPTPGVTDSSPANVRAAVEGSLRRLGTDYIDLYYQHRVDPGTPIEDTVQTLAELVAEGKIRHIGLPEASPNTIRRAHAVHPV